MSALLLRLGALVPVVALGLLSVSATPADEFVSSGAYARAVAAAADCQQTFIPDLDLPDLRSDDAAGSASGLGLTSDATSPLADVRWGGGDLRALYSTVADTAGRLWRGDLTLPDGRDLPEGAEASTRRAAELASANLSPAGTPAAGPFASDVAAAGTADDEASPHPDAAARRAPRAHGPHADPDEAGASGTGRALVAATPWAAGARRVEVYGSASTNHTVSVMSSSITGSGMQGCTRLVITGPQTMQVAMQSRSGLRYNGQYPGVNRSIWTPEITEAETRQTGLVRLYRNGRPEIGARVRLWVTANGQYSRFGTSPGHTHVFNAATSNPNSREALPTLRLGYFPSGAGSSVRMKGRGEVLDGVTNAQGEFSFVLQSGYRGGVERVWAQWTGAPDAASGAAQGMSLAMRWPGLQDFGIIHGFSSTRPPVQTASYPYLLVGATSMHNMAHYMQPEVGARFDAGMRRLWQMDLTPAEQQTSVANAARGPGAAGLWIQLNDMALEYGGIFRAFEPNDCADPDNLGSPPGHVNHNVGVDIDFRPCYSATNGGGGCGKNISKPHLLQIVEGEMGGLLFKHGAGARIDHYHVRLPGRGLTVR